MEDQTKEIAQLLDDFRYIKNTVMKNNRVFKFVSSSTLRPVYLFTGLVIIIFATVIQLLMQHFGSYTNIPGMIKTVYYIGLAVCTIWLSYTKLKLLLKRMRELGSDITIPEFFKEIYTWNTLVLMTPYMIVMGLVAVFLVSRGLSGYLVPFLAILYGLMINSATSLLFLREFMIGAVWFLLTGLTVLFTLGPSQPLLGLVITFGLGFIVMYAASLVFATDKVG